MYKRQGPNGSGKTNLLYAVTNIIPQHVKAHRDGNIMLKDNILNELPINQLSPDLMITLQNPEWQLLFPTVEEEIIYALENIGLSNQDIESRINQSLSYFQLESFRTSNPLKLSYGYQRLLQLCIIEAVSPEVILLDEPFIGLSDANLNLVTLWLEYLKLNNKIIIVAEHHEQVSELSSNQLCLQQNGYSYA